MSRLSLLYLKQVALFLSKNFITRPANLSGRQKSQSRQRVHREDRTDLGVTGRPHQYDLLWNLQHRHPPHQTTEKHLPILPQGRTAFPQPLLQRQHQRHLQTDLHRFSTSQKGPTVYYQLFRWQHLPIRRLSTVLQLFISLYLYTELELQHSWSLQTHQQVKVKIVELATRQNWYHSCVSSGNGRVEFLQRLNKKQQFHRVIMEIDDWKIP